MIKLPNIQHYRPLVKRFAVLAIIAAGYYLWFQGFYNKIAYNKIIPYPSLDVATRVIVRNFIPIALIFVLNYLVVFVFTKRLRQTSIKIGVDIVASLSVLVAVNMAYILLLGSPIVDWAGTLFNNIFIFLGMEVAYYVSNYRRTVMEKEINHRQMIQYQYDALRAQVNPHFLFNSLNILYSLIDVDVEKSRSFVMSLSQMYRYIVQHHGCQRVALAEELDFLKAYVEVLKMRYHNCFEVVIVGEEYVGCHKVIPYCMQLLMENVTKHNVIQTNLPMVVCLTISQSGFTMSNPIHPKREQTPSGIGLQYIAKLYRHQGLQFCCQNDGNVFTASVPYLK